MLGKIIKMDILEKLGIANCKHSVIILTTIKYILQNMKEQMVASSYEEKIILNNQLSEKFDINDDIYGMYLFVLYVLKEKNFINYKSTIEFAILTDTGLELLQEIKDMTEDDYV